MQNKIALIEDISKEYYKIYNAKQFTNKKIGLFPIGKINKYHAENIISTMVLNKGEGKKLIIPFQLKTGSEQELKEVLKKYLPTNYKSKEIVFNTPIFT